MPDQLWKIRFQLDFELNTSSTVKAINQSMNNEYIMLRNMPEVSKQKCERVNWLTDDLIEQPAM